MKIHKVKTRKTYTLTEKELKKALGIPAWETICDIIFRFGDIAEYEIDIEVQVEDK